MELKYSSAVKPFQKDNWMIIMEVKTDNGVKFINGNYTEEKGFYFGKLSPWGFVHPTIDESNIISWQYGDNQFNTK